MICSGLWNFLRAEEGQDNINKNKMIMRKGSELERRVDHCASRQQN